MRNKSSSNACGNSSPVLKHGDSLHALVEESKAGILRFAAEHPQEICSFFAYDANAVYGEFHLCFDTLENGLLAAQNNEREAMERRNKCSLPKEIGDMSPIS